MGGVGGVGVLGEAFGASFPNARSCSLYVHTDSVFNVSFPSYDDIEASELKKLIFCKTGASLVSMESPEVAICFACFSSELLSGMLAKPMPPNIPIMPAAMPSS